MRPLLKKVVAVPPRLASLKAQLQLAYKTFLSTVPKWYQTLHILTETELADILLGPRLDIPIFKDRLSDMPTWPGIFLESVTSSRQFFNEHVSQRSRVALFNAKLQVYAEPIGSFLERLAPGQSLNLSHITDVSDLTSFRVSGKAVYRLRFQKSEDATPVDLILKLTEDTIAGTSKSKLANERFVEAAFTRLGIGLPIPTAKLSPTVYIMQFIPDSQPLGGIFKKGHSTLDLATNRQVLRQLARYAAFFDLFLKGDRNIGISDPENSVTGNFLLAASGLYAIDNEYMFNTHPKYMESDAKKGSIEATFILSYANETSSAPTSTFCLN